MKWNNTYSVITALSVIVLIFGGLSIYFLTSQHYLKQQLQIVQQEKDLQREKEAMMTDAVTNLLSGDSQHTSNAQRRFHVNTILNAVYQYAIDQNGKLPAVITTEGGEICRTGVSDCSGFIDLSILNGRYLTTIPADDPIATHEGGGRGTGYEIALDSNNRIMVISAYATGGEFIFVTR